jgi:hypothetical protein
MIDPVETLTPVATSTLDEINISDPKTFAVLQEYRSDSPNGVPYAATSGQRFGRNLNK